MDWYKAKEGRDFEAQEDPVFCLYLRYITTTKTTVTKLSLWAQVSNIDEILELAGCDV